MLYFNPLGLDVKHVKPKPMVGQKVRVIKDSLFTQQEVRKLVKLDDTITIEEILPVVEGDEHGYSWDYTIFSEEFPDKMILGSMYELI